MSGLLGWIRGLLGFWPGEDDPEVGVARAHLDRFLEAAGVDVESHRRHLQEVIDRSGRLPLEAIALVFDGVRKAGRSCNFQQIAPAGSHQCELFAGHVWAHQSPDENRELAWLPTTGHAGKLFFVSIGNDVLGCEGLTVFASLPRPSALELVRRS